MTAPTQLVQLLCSSSFSHQSSHNMIPETLTFHDGSSMEFLRSQALDESQWRELQSYLSANPAEAAKLADFSSNPDTIRKEESMRVISDFLQLKLDVGDESLRDSMNALECDEQFEELFKDIRAQNSQKVHAHLADKVLMSAICSKIGGVPPELLDRLENIRNATRTLQDACKNGDETAVREYLAETAQPLEMRDLESKDQRGITCLGYAVGADRKEVAQLLLNANANAAIVDAHGNSAMHYAAGYGREDMMNLLLDARVDANRKNNFGQLPIDVATKNRQMAAVALLTRG